MEELLKQILEEVKGIRSDIQNYLQENTKQQQEAQIAAKEKMAKLADLMPSQFKDVLR